MKASYLKGGVKSAEEIFKNHFPYGINDNDGQNVCDDIFIIKCMEDYASQFKSSQSDEKEELWQTLNGIPSELHVEVKLTDGSILTNMLSQSDGDFYSETLRIFINPEHVTHWRKP